MAQKPEIQYIGQFYVHGSEARALQLQQKQAARQKKAELPQPQIQRIRKVQVDVLAIVSLLMAVVLLVVMVSGVMQLQEAWQELRIAQQYVSELETANRSLTVRFRSAYDLEQVRSAALAMGMIPAAEASTMKVRVTVPQPEPERTVIDDMVWFLEGLLAP